MEHRAEIFVEADAETVGAVVGDLSTYPLWNDVVASAELIDGEMAGGDGSRPTWATTLRARVGPFSRSKQLRMVRTLDESNDGIRSIRFERDEIDGRDHAAWTMNARIAPADRETGNGSGEGCRVELGLEYTGGLWNPGLEIVLGTAIERATRNLSDYLERR